MTRLQFDLLGPGDVLVHAQNPELVVTIDHVAEEGSNGGYYWGISERGEFRVITRPDLWKIAEPQP